MKVNYDMKNIIVFEDLEYGDAFSFYSYGNKDVYIKIKDSISKAVNVSTGNIITLGGLEPVIKHNAEILIN